MRVKVVERIQVSMHYLEEGLPVSLFPSSKDYVLVLGGGSKDGTASLPALSCLATSRIPPRP